MDVGNTVLLEQSASDKLMDANVARAHPIQRLPPLAGHDRHVEAQKRSIYRNAPNILNFVSFVMVRKEAKKKSTKQRFFLDEVFSANEKEFKIDKTRLH